MYKKLNQYLLTHYPLVWNLKLPWILLWVLILHLTAFIIGYVHVHSTDALQEESLRDTFYRKNYFMFFFTVILISIIIWIRFYIKNNRLKSGYPTSRRYLFSEFLGVLFIFFSFTFIPNSFELGLKQKISGYLSDEDFSKDLDVINRTGAFTLDGSQGYGNFSRNLSVPIFDKLVSESAVKKKYEYRNREYLKKYSEAQYGEFLKPYFRNKEYEELLITHFPERLQKREVKTVKTHTGYTIDKEEDIYLQETIAAVDASAYVTFNEEDEDDDEHYNNLASLYNYSHLVMANSQDASKDQMYYDQKLIELLGKNDKNLIKAEIDDYIALLDKFKLGYRFRTKTFSDYIPSAPHYFIDEYISKEGTHYDNGILVYNDYLNTEALLTIYKNLEYGKFQFTYFDYFIGCLIFSLVCTLLLITFRFSSFKVWLISLIGAAVLGVIGGCFGILLSYLFSNSYSAYLIYFGFYFMFILVFLFFMRKRKRKIITGVTLNWLVWSSLCILMLIMSFISDVYSERFIKHMGNDYESMWKDPVYLQLQEWSSVMLWLNPILLIIAFYGFSECYRKWQALPEE